MPHVLCKMNQRERGGREEGRKEEREERGLVSEGHGHLSGSVFHFRFT